MPNYTPGQRYQVDGQTATAGPDGVLYYDEPAAPQPPPFIPAPPPQQPTPLAPGQADALRRRGYVTPSGGVELGAAPTPLSEADRLAAARAAAAAEKSAAERRVKAQRLAAKADEAMGIINSADTRLGWGTEGQPGSFGIGPWINTATGTIGGITRDWAGYPANDLNSTFDTMGSILGLNEIMGMKADSPNGTGLGGQTSDRDMTLLMSSVAKLDPGLTRPRLESNIRQVRDEAARRGGIDRPRAERPRPPGPQGLGGLGAMGSRVRPGPPARAKRMEDMTDAELQAIASRR